MELEKKKKFEKEVEECTFRPKTCRYDSRKSIERPKSALDKNLELYARAKPYGKKSDKTRDDFDYEKGADELTFKPNTGKPGYHDRTKTSIYNSRDSQNFAST